jgi:hypothetical protein
MRENGGWAESERIYRRISVNRRPSVSMISDARQLFLMDEKIQYFQNKKDLIKKLETLDGYTKTIETVTEEVLKAAGENGFFTEAFTLKVVRKVSYRDDVEVLKVQNPTVINEVLGFALASINAKREELKNLINA